MKINWLNALFLAGVSLMVVVSCVIILKTFEKKAITDEGIEVVAKVVEAPLGPTASADSENQEEANINIIVSDYELKVSEYIGKHTDTLRTHASITEIDVKELNINDINEAFQRKFKIERNLYEGVAFQTFYGRKDLGKVFIITINSKYGLYRKYEPIFESVLSSFRMY